MWYLIMTCLSHSHNMRAENFKEKNLSFASTQTHAGFLWAQQISPVSLLFLSDPTAVTDMLLTHTAHVPYVPLSSSFHLYTPEVLRGNWAGQSYVDVCRAQSKSHDTRQIDNSYCSSYRLNATSFPRIFHNICSGHWSKLDYTLPSFIL